MACAPTCRKCKRNGQTPSCFTSTSNGYVGEGQSTQNRAGSVVGRVPMHAARGARFFARRLRASRAQTEWNREERC